MSYKVKENDIIFWRSASEMYVSIVKYINEDKIVLDDLWSSRKSYMSQNFDIYNYDLDCVDFWFIIPDFEFRSFESCEKEIKRLYPEYFI